MHTRKAYVYAEHGAGVLVQTTDTPVPSAPFVPVVLAVERVDEAVADKLVHAHARYAREVQLLEARLALVVLLHVARLEGYSPVRLVHVHREAARGGGGGAREDRRENTGKTKRRQREKNKLFVCCDPNALEKHRQKCVCVSSLLAANTRHAGRCPLAVLAWGLVPLQKMVNLPKAQ